MSDDIVTRLRDVGFSLGLHGDAGQNRVTVFQAADEIERLRELADENHKRGMLQVKCTDKAWEAYAEVEADRDRWKSVAWLGYQVIMNKWEYTQFEQAYEEAVRGE